MSEKSDKRRKAEPYEVDISNGQLFLRIMQLEHWVEDLKQRVLALEYDARDPVKHNIRIGGSR